MAVPHATEQIRAGRPHDYLIAVVSVALLGALQPILVAWLGQGSPFLLFAVLVFLLAHSFGPRVAAVAAILSALAGLTFLLQSNAGPAGWNQFALFVVAASCALLLTALFRGSERKRMEAQDQAAQLARQLQSLIDSVPSLAICMLDLEGRVTIWNAGAERLFGWTEELVLGREMALFFAPEERAAHIPAQHLVDAQQQGSIDVTGWRIRRDGSDFLANVTLSLVRNEKGEAIGFAKVVRDITNDQATAASIEAREMLLRSILDTVPDAMVLIDEQGIMTSFSAAAERLFGYSQDEVIGKNVAMLMTDTDRSRHDDYLAHYRDTGERRIMGRTRRVVARRKDGTVFPHELHIGEAVGGGTRVFTGFIRDLTAREEGEARVQELQAELLHIARIGAMGTMASTLAHELNQPLTAVANYVDTCRALLSQPQEPPVDLLREALAEAGSEAIRAGRIVTRLREFVARGQVDKSVVPLDALIEDARMLALADAREKGVSHSVSIDPAVGPLLIDPVQIEQVLINLLRNALEAMTPAGGGHIAIIVRANGDFADIEVADNGPGIAPEIREALFKAFVSTKRDGMGLGLSICRTIVEAHGGRIWADYRMKRDGDGEEGTSFHLTLPRAAVEDGHE